MRRRLVAAAIGAAIAAIYVLRLDQAAGLYVDDAWYIVLAEALWSGQGFRLISSAAAPIVPAVPPGFPMLLAPVVGLTAHFPDNVFALKAVSIVAMFGVGIVTFFYIERCYRTPRRVAAAVAIVTVTLPAFVFLATSTVMAEAAFTLTQLLLAFVIERAAEKESRRSTLIAGGLIGAATLLIRLAGVASVAGAVFYLWWRRGFKPVVALAGILFVCYAPWAWYAIANASSPGERAAHGGSMAARYDELLLMRRGGEPSSGRVTLSELPGRIVSNAVELFALDSGPFIIPSGYRGADESGLEALQLSRASGIRASTMGGSAAAAWLSAAVSVVMLAGFIDSLRRRITVAELFVALTVAMVLLVPARTFRYMLPLAPFLIFYFFNGVNVLARLARGAEFGAAFRVSTACVIALLAIEHMQYITLMHTGTPPWLRDYAEVKGETDWMRLNLRREGPIATSNPGLIYLTTGRKAMALTNLRRNWLELQRAGVPYGATLHMTAPPAVPDFPMLYESPRLKLWVVEIPAPVRTP